MNKVIVAGSREHTDREIVREHMNRLWREIGPYEIVSGTARGVDTIGASLAKDAGITVHEYPANWQALGRRAGYIRNQVMAQNATHLLAIWDGHSRGTRHMIDIAKQAGLTVQVYRTDKELLIKY